jgi:hypothetical protein
MTDDRPRAKFAVTRDLEKAKRRFPWARAWVHVRNGVWCFEDPREARVYRPGGAYEAFLADEPGPRKRRAR